MTTRTSSTPTAASALRASSATTAECSTLTTGARVMWWISAEFHAVPAPISSTRRPGARSAASSIFATIDGWDVLEKVAAGSSGVCVMTPRSQ